MKTIMIVDDEPDNIISFVDALSQENYSFLTAPNGVECLKIAQEENPDLILLDVNMPGMSGYETITQLRSLKKYKYTPIVFLSGVAVTPTAIDSGFKLGGTEYWTKPISQEELTVRVRAALRIAETEKQLRHLQQSFYSMIVHDLRNPIGAILGMSEFLLEDKKLLKEDHVQMAAVMNSASNQLLQILKDLLELSQFESGEYQLERKNISLDDIIEASLIKTGITQNQKKITIETDIEEDLTASVDVEYFGEVLDNLFDNALRYTSTNGKITVKTKHQAAKETHSSNSIIIEVTDSGCGISKDELPTLFDKNRINNAKFRKANTRTGLGLVVCREIMEAHGGTISVESEVGKGSTFTLTLPE